MLITEAQADLRQAFARGAAGQLVSGVLWLAAAALGTWSGSRLAMVTLIVGGFLIYPATSLLLKLAGRPGALPSGHPFTGLSMQVAFTLPLGIPLVLWAAETKPLLFFPGMAILLGAHYLPFAFMYGMAEFLGLAAAVLGVGYWFGWASPGQFATAGWWVGGILLLFALWQGARARAAA